MKTKLLAASSLLVLLVLIVGIWSQVLIYQLAEEAKTIAVENYRSIDYAVKMLQALDEIQSYHERQYLHVSGDSPDDRGRALRYRQAVDVFDANLAAEENNITEIGEADTTHNLRTSYSDYQSAFKAIQLYERFDAITYYVELRPKIEKIRRLVYSIEDINLAASNLKSDKPHQIANPVFTWMQIIGNLSIVLSLLILFFIKLVLEKIST